MSDIQLVCEQIQRSLEGSCCHVSEAYLRCSGSERIKAHIPAGLIYSSSIALFIEFDNNDLELPKNDLANKFRMVLHTIAKKMDLSINSFLLYGYFNGSDKPGDASRLCVFNIYNDRIQYFSFDEELKDFVDLVVGDMSYRNAIFETNELAQIALSFELATGANGDITKDSEGNFYINKGGTWYLASDMDPNDLFQKAVFFGAFGAHKFAEMRRGMGLFYFLTCGLFGVGWLFDCLSIIFGIYKDSEGRYLLPISDRKACVFKLLGGAAVTAIYMVVFHFIFTSLGDWLNSILNSSIETNEDLAGGFWEE